MLRAFIESVSGSVVSSGERFTKGLANGRRLRLRACGAVAVAGMLLLPGAAFAFFGQTGSAVANYSGAATVDAFGTPVFTAPQTVTCMVTVDLTTSTQNASFSPTGTQVMWPEAKIAGSNQFSGQGVYVSSTVLGGYYTSHNTRLFTVSSGQTAQFGCHLSSSGTFADSRISGGCTITYVCQ